MNSISRSYYPAIDGMRALAVISVILFHFEIPYFEGGFIGVDVFFVISGFLISRNILFDLSENQFSFKRFYVARFRRLIPALLATIAFSLLFAFLLYSPDALVRVGSSAIAGVVSLANIRYWMNSGYFDIDAASKPLLHLWSLSVEEQFYVIWPLFLIFIYRLFKDKFSLPLMILVVLVASLFWSQHAVVNNPSSAFYLVQFRVYEFAVGSFLAHYDLKKSFNVYARNSLGLNCLTLGGLALLCLTVVTFDSETLFPGYLGLIPCLATAMIIKSNHSNVAEVLLSNRLFRWIGKISYSLYLVHWPLWVYWTFWYFQTPTLLQKVVLFLFVLLLGNLLFIYVEQKFRTPRLFANSDSNNRSFFISLVIVGLLILGSAWQIRVNSGFPNRVAGYKALPDYNNISCEYINGIKGDEDCFFGARKPIKRGLLVGDSHSLNIRAAFDKLGTEQKYSLRSVSYAGCPPLLELELRQKQTSNLNERCIEFENKLAELFVSDDFDFVIIVARWMWYFEHDFYHVLSQPKNTYLLDLNHRELNAQSSRDVWVSGLERTLSRITDSGKKVVLFSQAPLMSKGIGECNKSPSYIIDQSKNKERCKVRIPYSTIMDRLKFTNTTIKNLANNNILAIIPSDYICDVNAQACNILRSQGLLYYDSNHLSREGTMYLMNSIDQKIISFLNDE